MNECKNCEGRGAVETGITEASATQCRRCDGTGQEPDIKDLLKRRILKEHGGNPEYELNHHWNLSRHDSLLHADALRVIGDLERALNHLRHKHAFNKPAGCIGNPEAPEACYRVRCQLGKKCAEAE